MTFWTRSPAPESPLQRRHGDLVEALKLASRALEAGDVAYAGQIIGIAISTEAIRSAAEADIDRELRAHWDHLQIAACQARRESVMANDEKKPLGKERLHVQTQNTNTVNTDDDHTEPPTWASTD